MEQVGTDSLRIFFLSTNVSFDSCSRSERAFLILRLEHWGFGRLYVQENRRAWRNLSLHSRILSVRRQTEFTPHLVAI